MLIQVVYKKLTQEEALASTSYGYTFATDLPGLQVGDYVEVPGSWFDETPRLATVVSLNGGDYNGPVSTIFRQIK